MHNQAYPRIIQAYSGIFGTLCNRWHRTMIYPEPSHIQYRQHIQKPGIFRTPVYSERWHIHNLRHIQNRVRDPRGSVLRK